MISINDGDRNDRIITLLKTTFEMDFHRLTSFITYASTGCGGYTMPTKNPRINVVCEHPLYYELNSIAASENTSVSSLAHNLIKEALELR